MTPHVEETIERYFEGRVTEIEERDALFGHLDRCLDCRGRFDELASIHRMLGGGVPGGIPSTELALVRSSVVSGATRKTSDRRWRIGAYLAAIAMPAAAAFAVAAFVLPRSDLTAKGGGAARADRPAIEVICFDERAEIREHLRSDGRCPAPGYLKLVYAAPRTVPHLLIAALSGDEVRAMSVLTMPEPRSVLPEHVKIAPGERVRIVAVSSREPIPRERAQMLSPILVVTGVAQ